MVILAIIYYDLNQQKINGAGRQDELIHGLI